MKAALLAGLCAGLFALATSCAGAPAEKKTSGEPTPITVVPPQDEGEGEVDSRGKKWGGWRYKGSRDDCYYLYKGRCYTDDEKACKAAGCDDVDDCEFEGAGPATVTCLEKDAKK